MIDYQLSAGVCTLTLNAPPLNTISLDALDALVAAVARANGDGAVHAIVLVGRTDHFSAGADINLFRQIDNADDARRISRVFQEAFQKIEDSAKPITAAALMMLVDEGKIALDDPVEKPSDNVMKLN